MQISGILYHYCFSDFFIKCVWICDMKSQWKVLWGINGTNSKWISSKYVIFFNENNILKQSTLYNVYESIKNKKENEDKCLLCVLMPISKLLSIPTTNFPLQNLSTSILCWPALSSTSMTENMLYLAFSWWLISINTIPDSSLLLSTYVLSFYVSKQYLTVTPAGFE